MAHLTKDLGNFSEKDLKVFCVTQAKAPYQVRGRLCGCQACSPDDARIPYFGENDKRNF
jgi:hypothetical protein